MKWLAFILSLLAFTCLHRSVEAKTPRTVTLSEAEVATVRTALGYTTMLQFDGRPTSAVLGDQDAFKVEYVGNSLAIKPVVPGARTNLFVFTNYDRFNFRLVAGASGSADFLIRVKRESYASYTSSSAAPTETGPEPPLHRQRINKRSSCGGLTLRVDTVAWPESQSTYLIQFKAEVRRNLTNKAELRFEPGDFAVFQSGKSLPIDSLHLNKLVLTKESRSVEGTMVLRQSVLRRGRLLQLRFTPDFHRSKHPNCPRVSFSRRGVT